MLKQAYWVTPMLATDIVCRMEKIIIQVKKQNVLLESRGKAFALD